MSTTPHFSLCENAQMGFHCQTSLCMYSPHGCFLLLNIDSDQVITKTWSGGHIFLCWQASKIVQYPLFSLWENAQIGWHCQTSLITPWVFPAFTHRFGLSNHLNMLWGSHLPMLAGLQKCPIPPFSAFGKMLKLDGIVRPA